MTVPNFYNQNRCPRQELAAYIDGELLPREEIELEAHLAECSICVFELNEQKRLLSALDFALEGEKQFALPADFTKIVVANAESNVQGLRCPNERFKAVFVFAVLFLLFLLGLGENMKTVVGTFLNFAQQILVVGNFAAHLIYDVAVAASLILRFFCSQFVYRSAVSITVSGVLFVVGVFIVLRLFNRYHEA